MLSRLKPVLIEWLDIVDGGAEWRTDTPSPVKVRTVGYIYRRTQKHIVVIRDYHDLEEHRTIGGSLAIPTGCIVKITHLSPTPSPKKDKKP